MAEKPKDFDAVTRTPTTGHEWDGIQERNTPLPRWWLWVFYATIVWSIAYWLVYPSWPLVSSYTKGLFDWHSRESIVRDMEELKVIRGPLAARISTASLQEIFDDPQLLDFARAQARPIFSENCSGCHGSGGSGAKGYPNLNDDDWLWGGKLDEIAAVIRHGVRALDPQTKPGGMPAFGRDGMMKRDEIDTVSDYVRSLSGLPVDQTANLDAGRKLFEVNCAACHGAEGKGNREIGAPDLTDKIWLHGSDKATIAEGLWNGRNGVMPAWASRLDDATIKALAVYVYALSGGRR